MKLAFLGFGNVNRALYALLLRQRDALAREYNITFTITGVASRRTGWRANVDGLDPVHPHGATCDDIHAWLATARPDAVFEAIALDPHSGQPALDYLRAILECGAHAISANKGPVVHGYAELERVAKNANRHYRFESAVMDGAPLFSLVRECLPLVGLSAIRGVFTSTATVVLEAVEQGFTMAHGIARAQTLGSAEADPSYDVDGWDSAVKLCAVANVLLGGALRPEQVTRTGIGSLREDDVRRAHAEGRPYRLVGEVVRTPIGVLNAQVGPQRLDALDALAVRGTTLVTHFEADMFPGGLTITSRDPDPTTTAYGLLADLINVEKGVARTTI